MNGDGIDRETDFPSPFTLHDDRPTRHGYCHKARKELRDKVQSDVAGFLQAGGEIERLPYMIQTSIPEMQTRFRAECWKDKNARHRRINDTLPAGAQKLRSFDP